MRTTALNEKFRLLCSLVIACLMVIMPFESAQAGRIKDLTTFQGVRANKLLGYGLVVGLNGTGDGSSAAPFTAQSLRNMLTQYGITVPSTVSIRPKNVAAVSVHADLPPFAKPGQQIDITVSSLGDAKSLRGGSLLMMTLRGPDGQVYALAQGELVVGGMAASGSDGSSITVNIPSAGRIPNGATVERAVPNTFTEGGPLVLNLNEPDFTTAIRMQEAINKLVGAGTATALDPSSVALHVPAGMPSRVSFVAYIENLEFTPGSAPAKIIVNSRTGTVVIGAHVRVSPVAVTHGNLTVTISENTQVSQPQPFSQGGSTQVVPRSGVEVGEDENRMFVLKPGVTLDTIVKAVNEVGAGPSDLVAILEALKQAGALHAQLIII